MGPGLAQWSVTEGKIVEGPKGKAHSVLSLALTRESVSGDLSEVHMATRFSLVCLFLLETLN